MRTAIVVNVLGGAVAGVSLQVLAAYAGLMTTGTWVGTTQMAFKTALCLLLLGLSTMILGWRLCRNSE